MRFEIIKKEDFVVHGWSGGTTAEIFLYPPSSHWEKKDFQIRVSSADCRIDGAPYSDFTGYTRHICPLRGTMQMVHEGHHEIKLNPYEVDIFDGAWLTYHTGIAIDFNLLHTNRWNGSMKAIESGEFLCMPEFGLIGFFAVTDTDVFFEQENVLLKEGDFVIFHDVPPSTEFRLTAQNATTCVMAVFAFPKESQK